MTVCISYGDINITETCVHCAGNDYCKLIVDTFFFIEPSGLWVYCSSSSDSGGSASSI